MQINNLTTFAGKSVSFLELRDGKIAKLQYGAASVQDRGLDLSGSWVFPGIINSHEHLEFNLYPALGNGGYNNYIEWSSDIQQNRKKEIDEVFRVPLDLRAKWGMYKNLLCGITTVVNHGQKLKLTDKFLQVLQNTHSIHSLSQKNWELSLLDPFNWKLVAIHIGEGTDKNSHDDIDRLLRANILKKDLVGIHAVAMDEKQAKSFKAIAWCPASNFFLFGKTAAIDRLIKQTAIVFGTDSTLTAPWNFWEHLRQARKTQLVGDEALFDMLNIVPAKTWGLTGAGILEEGKQADIVVAGKNASSTDRDKFFELNPADILLVFCHGQLRVCDASLYDKARQMEVNLENFSRVMVDGAVKHVYGDLAELIGQVRNWYPGVQLPVTNCS